MATHEKFVISDHHFFHDNTWAKFKMADGSPLRQFSNNGQMHEYMIRKWNSVVGPYDFVYHLGDVTFKYDRKFDAVMHCLNGRKRLILGNHDKLKGTNLMDWFEKVELWKGFKDKTDDNRSFTMTHIPATLDELRDGTINVHGHTHARFRKDPRYINVCVEPRDYTPVHFDQIFKEIDDINYKLKHKDTNS